MASYCIDWPWLYSFFDPNTPVICVAQPDETGNFSMKEVLPGWIKTTPVLRGGRGCMHMKVPLNFSHI
jgi:tyrosyl-DNA phosphodiesterase 1